MAELLIGCGNRREKAIKPHGREGWSALTTLDIDPASGADVVHDLEVLPLPFADGAFQEIHAYEVLEHTGRQGDYRFFFAQFSEFWRILEPNGLLCGSVPLPTSPWAWGDPSHTRVLPRQVFTFLDQQEYVRQVGKTGMTDFRRLYRADFTLAWGQETEHSFYFILQARKP